MDKIKLMKSSNMKDESVERNPDEPVNVTRYSPNKI